MTDRVPGAPGQHKAIITETELQKMQNGEQFVITMTRDDQPIIEGTPYSKAAVLPDELAEKICPNVEDPTPADALRGLYSKMEESADYPGCYYRMVDGEQEWINPPMMENVEYRTTKRYSGKTVYTRLITMSELPNNTDRYIGFESFNKSCIVGCSAWAKTRDGNISHVIPSRWYDGSTLKEVFAGIFSYGLTVKTNYNASEFAGYFAIEYTKD